MYTPNFSRLFFDIETVVNPDAVPLMPEPAAPANLRDPLKIEAAIAEKRADQLASAPLDPDYGKILCIGYTLNPIEPAIVLSGSEESMLDRFWRQFAGVSGRCAGYNILGFDLPYLLRRSFALGIKVPVFPNLSRFRTEPVTDLMQILYNWDARGCKGLKTVAKLYGIPNSTEGISGADVANLPLEKVIEYCRSDVALTCALFAKMNGVYFYL